MWNLGGGSDESANNPDLSAYEDQNAGSERQNTHHNRGNHDCMDKQTQSSEDQINCQQEHSEIFRNVYHVSLSLGKGVAKPGNRRAAICTCEHFVGR
jgi:hypothetical protein